VYYWFELKPHAIPRLIPPCRTFDELRPKTRSGGFYHLVSHIGEKHLTFKPLQHLGMTPEANCQRLQLLGNIWGRKNHQK